MMKFVFAVTLGFLFSFIAPAQVQAQAQTYEQCVSTVKTRASLTLSNDDIQKICDENSMAVIDCALTMIQGARFSANLDQSIKRCRLEWNSSN